MPHAGEREKLMSMRDHSHKIFAGEFLFFTVFYMGFGGFVLGMNAEKSVEFFLSVMLCAGAFGYVCAEIYTRRAWGYYAHQLITLPLLIIFIVLNYHVLELLRS